MKKMISVTHILYKQNLDIYIVIKLRFKTARKKAC